MNERNCKGCMFSELDDSGLYEICTLGDKCKFQMEE
jgi:hypothetical protein